MTASAATLQQHLPYWLKVEPAQRRASAASEAPAGFYIIVPIGIVLGIIVVIIARTSFVPPATRSAEHGVTI
jgi:hypothetical protein